MVSSPLGLAHYPTMEAFVYFLPSVFEPPSDSKPGPEGGPAGPIAVNTPAVKPRGTKFSTNTFFVIGLRHSSSGFVKFKTACIALTVLTGPTQYGRVD